MFHRETVNATTLGLLKGVMAAPALSRFYLAGGTGLALQLGHRTSLDVDLFTQSPFDSRSLGAELAEHFSFQVVGEARNTLNIVSNGVKVDLIAYQYPLLGDVVVSDGIRVASVQDIACMKLSAVASRGAKRDFYDIYYLLGRFTLSEILEMYQRKYAGQELFHVLKSLVYFDDAEGEPAPHCIKPATWDEVKQALVNAVRALPLT